MKKQIDLNHVSMSSIEPATNTHEGTNPSGHAHASIDSSALEQPTEPNDLNMQSDSDDINQQPLHIDVPEIPTFSQNQSQLDNKLTFAGLNNNIHQKLAESNLSLNHQKQERNLMSKNTMQSGVSLQQTGRFEVTEERPPHLGSDLKYQGTNLIGTEESPDHRDFKMHQEYRETEELQENEMRETSYFKHVSNENGSQADLYHHDNRQNHRDEIQDPKQTNFNELITIQMQEQTPSGEKTLNEGAMSISKVAESDEAEVDEKRNSVPMDKGIQLFKMSSRNHMRQRSNRNTKVMDKGPNPSIDVNSIVNQHQNEPNTPADTSDSKFFNNQQIKLIEPQTPNESNMSSGKKKINLIHSRHSRFEGNKSLDNSSPGKGLRQISINKPQNIEGEIDSTENSPKETIPSKELLEILKTQSQMATTKNVTGNFGELNIQKNQSTAMPNINSKMLANDEESNAKEQQQMFTSMSDIGFPNAQAKPGASQKKGPVVVGNELISSDQIQRMMNTQNNWRVRTKCIDEMMHDIQERIDSDPEYIMVVSEKLVDFFVKLLTDQNFKIVLNTLNILNMIIGMKEQCLRFEKLMKQELSPDQTWGLSNATLGRHIPQIVKKLADSKNIIRQEAIKCLFCMFEIMRSGSKKDNNFIALILPYLINSTNWHIREELLHLLIKCFLLSQDVQEFDGYQILDSVLRLFNDAKEKIRNLALEAIAAYSSINSKKNINEILFQLKVEKDLIDIVNQRMDQGMLPYISTEGTLELPFQDQMQNLNYDVDSVAHSMANQSQVGQPQHFVDNSRRKASIGGVSQSSYPNMNRGNSSGRKIVVTTATATNQQLGISQHDEMQQPFFQSKRTASANNPNQLDFENPNFNPHDPPFLIEQNAFSQSVGEAGARSKDLKIMQQYDDPIFQQELSGTSFLPQLQKINYNDSQNNNQYQSQNYYKERVVGSSGGSGMGNINIQGKVDPSQIIGSAGSMGGQHMAQISGGNRRSNKYLHGTPGHPHNYHGHFSQNETPLNHVFHRGNSGKLNPNQNINNSIYNKSPSLFDSNLLMEMSGNIGSMFGAESKNGIKMIPRSNFNQQMSEIAINDFHDSLSNSGVNHSNYYHQTPSQHDQFMIQPSVEGSMISTKFPLEFNLVTQIPGHGNVNKIGFSSPVNAVVNTREGFIEQKPLMEGYDQQANPNMNEQSQQKLIPQKNQKSSSMHKREGSMGHLNQKVAGIGVAVQSSKKNNQNTFYSDGTTFTGITATTGATNSIKGMKQRNQIVMLKPGGPPNMSEQINQMQEEGINRFDNNEIRQQIIGPGHPQIGPIKATRVAIENQVQSINSNEPINQQNVELCIDSRKFKQGQHKLKINTKVQNSQGIQKMKREYSKESDLDDNLRQTRSFSYTKESKQNSIHSSKELQSAGIPNRYGYFGKNFTGDENDEDPALLTQSSKIVYISSDQLQPLEHPEKEYKKITAKDHGMYSNDWVEQFEACDVVRRVCKHHQSMIIQNGNQLQNLIANLVKLADSLRSAVSRIALMTLNDMFVYLKRVMEPCLIAIVKILIKKGTDTNHFIAEEADKCLLNMVQNCQEQKVLQVLFMQNMNSGSNQQRFKLCLCLQYLAKQLGNNILFFKENDKLIVQLAKYLQDACQDVRQAAKTSFVLISQAIMGENELEKLLQRVLNEVLYKKVREFLDKEPTHLVGKQGSQIDFVITNANGSHNTNKRVSSKLQKSFKELKLGGLTQKQNPVEISENEPLNIQAKSILNPQAQKQESSGFLNKIASQNKGAKKGTMLSDSELDQEFLDQLKDLIGKVISNEWKLRLESSEILFEFIHVNVDKINSFRQVELADALCKLINDSNAKIQLHVLENFTKIFSLITPYIEQFIQIFYKATLSNLGSSNLGVRKNSEQILKQINEMNNEKMQLLQPLMNMIQFNSNARLKPALIDQLIDMIDQRSDKESHIFKSVLPLSYKLLDDNKIEVKQRTEKLFKKLYQIPSIGQTVIDNCPQTKLQRLCDICLGGSKLSLTGTGSSGKNSTGRGTGNFGANGNSVHLNSRT